MIRPLYLFGLISCICFAKSFGKFRRAPGLDDRLCVEELFSRSCSTLIRCAAFCASSSECEIFHYYPGTSTCVGCSSSSELQTPPTAASDDMAYVLGDRLTYIGCYQDSDARILSEPYQKTSTMTNDVCSELCRGLSFIYSGTQTGNECMCGNSFQDDKKIPDGECTDKCSGNQTQICGGYWKVSIST